MRPASGAGGGRGAAKKRLQAAAWPSARSADTANNPEGLARGGSRHELASSTRPAREQWGRAGSKLASNNQQQAAAATLATSKQQPKELQLQQQQQQQQQQPQRQQASLQQMLAAAAAVAAADGCQLEHRKQSHCEIEKRRRDKMNHYIMELASVIPSFTSNQSKFDKLTILRMAVHHVKSLRSSLCSFSSFHLRPSFLSSGNLLKNLILQMASQEARDNLFMVVTCDRAKVLFVSESSRDILNQDQHELVGQCLFDFLHKDDVSKVKEQILHSNVVPREMLVDSKTLQPIKLNQQQQRHHQSFSEMKAKSSSTPQPGARRSFFCRMRSGSANPHLAQLQLNQQQQQQQQADSSSHTTKPPVSASEATTTTTSSSASDPQTTTPSSASKRRTADSNSAATRGQLVAGNSSSSLSSDMNNKNDSTSSGIGSCEGATSSSGEQSAGSSTGSGSHVATKNKLANHHHQSHHSNYRSHKRKIWRYIVMHCTGYLKSITLKNDEFDDDDYESLNNNNNSNNNNSDNNQSDEEEAYGWRTINCLVVVCRRSPFDRDLKPDRPLTFTCRYSMDGKFTFVDQRTTMALGYTPQQLLGTSHYAYCHKDSVNTFKECHRQSILKSEPVSSDIYQFKRANGQNLWLQTSLKSFRNPWTKFIDYIIASHTTAEGNEPLYNEGCVPTKFNQDISGDGSQSSSPSSSLSLLSTDGKKSTVSTCSSSMASSYSLESYSSGGNIRALLNKIDRVRPSGPTAVADGDPKKKKSNNNNNNNNSGSGDDNNQLTSSSRGSSSTRKSQDDTGNYSDLQSCSSQSSQNSGGDFGPGLNRNSSVGCFNEGLAGLRDHQTGQANDERTTAMEASGGIVIGSVEPAMSINETEPQAATPAYYHRDEQKLNNVYPCGVEDMCAPPCHQIIQVAGPQQQQQRQQQQQQQPPQPQASTMQQVAPSTCRQSLDPGKLQTAAPYVIQSVVTNCPMTVISMGQSQAQQQTIQPALGARGPLQQMADTRDRYPTQMVPMNAYQVPPNVSPLYRVDVSSLAEHQGMQREPPMPMDASLTVGAQVMKVPQQMIQAQQGPQMNVSQMIWNPAAQIVQQQQQPASMGPNQAYHQAMLSPQQQICHQVVSNPELVALAGLHETSTPQLVLHQPPQQQQPPPQQQIQCQQCAHHKCSVQPLVTISNSTDLSDITSLAVDEELDEEQLLEYLAGCDSGPQLYYTQNNAFP